MLLSHFEIQLRRRYGSDTVTWRDVLRRRRPAIERWHYALKAPKVAVMIPHHKGIHPVLEWMLREGMTYPNYTVSLRQDPVSNVRPKDGCEVYERCSANREALRQEVLMDPDVEWVLSLDCDVLPPVDVVERLLRCHEESSLDGMKPKVVGGWYPVKTKDKLVGLRDNGLAPKVSYRQRWVAGMFCGGGLFANYYEPRRYKTAPSHLAPLGCCLIHRSVLEWACFESGCAPGQEMRDAMTRGRLVWGECVAFGKQVYDQGEVIGMAPDVICRHVDF